MDRKAESKIGASGQKRLSEPPQTSLRHSCGFLCARNTLPHNTPVPGRPTIAPCHSVDKVADSGPPVRQAQKSPLALIECAAAPFNCESKCFLICNYAWAVRRGMRKGKEEKMGQLGRGSMPLRASGLSLAKRKVRPPR